MSAIVQSEKCVAEVTRRFLCICMQKGLLVQWNFFTEGQLVFYEWTGRSISISAETVP